MIFVGDIALPYKNAINISSIPSDLRKKTWIGNLEGSLVKENLDLNSKKIVFNDFEAIKNLTKDLNIGGFLLANNHILDHGNIDVNFSNLKELNIPLAGLGKNLQQSLEPLKINEGGKNIIILNFGWEVIQCVPATKTSAGVPPLRKEIIFKQVKSILKNNHSSIILVFFHWSYELEREPQPFEREIAFKLIDLGVSGIIGCHPHRVGEIEIYKNKPIIYSLGNWLFKQNYYFDGKLSFPGFCDEQLAFEWDFESGEITLHWFNYDKDSDVINFCFSEELSTSNKINGLCPFKGLDNKAYSNWYRKNHYHKNKGLPVYEYHDSKRTILIKNTWNKLRDKGVKYAKFLKK